MNQAGTQAPPRKPFLARTAERALGLALALVEALIRRTPGGRRVFFDPLEFGWAARLEAGWHDAREELDRQLEERDRLPTFQAVSEEQSYISSDAGWKVFVFRVFGHPVVRNAERCPRTAALLGAIPGLRNAMFSILAPGKDIPEHRGPYAGLLRLHLALKVPADAARCVITVAGEERGWQEGRLLIFDDSYPHSVRNDTSEERVVLFADFDRPLSAPVAWVNRAMLAVLARSPLFRRPIEKFERGEL